MRLVPSLSLSLSPFPLLPLLDQSAILKLTDILNDSLDGVFIVVAEPRAPLSPAITGVVLQIAHHCVRLFIIEGLGISDFKYLAVHVPPARVTGGASSSSERESVRSTAFALHTCLQTKSFPFISHEVRDIPIVEKIFQRN